MGNAVDWDNLAMSPGVGSSAIEHETATKGADQTDEVDWDVLASSDLRHDLVNRKQQQEFAEDVSEASVELRPPEEGQKSRSSSVDILPSGQETVKTTARQRSREKWKKKLREQRENREISSSSKFSTVRVYEKVPQERR